MADQALMTVRALVAATGGTAFGESAVLDSGFSSVSIDSRSVQAGALFVALIGAERDGHDFIDKAFASGARVALAAASAMEKNGYELRSAAARNAGCIVVVDNTLRALQDAAAAYLDTFPGLLRVGITGSSGKTTTKELASAMISAEKRVVMNGGNLNSETGLPLSVFSVRKEHEVGIFEMGMNRRGEIGELAAVLRPHIALVTNIGTAHIGILGSLEAIAEEKKAIFSKFTGDELALVGEDEPFAPYLCGGLRGIARRFGAASQKAFGGARSLGLDGTEVTWAGVPARLSLPGAHNLANALAAAAIAEGAGVSDAAVRRGLESARPLFGRGEILRGEATVVRDCYNANPEAVEAAIAFCDSVEWSGRRVYVIGSMLELGSVSAACHARIGSALASSRADAVFLFGKETDDTYGAMASAGAMSTKTVIRSDDMADLTRAVSETVRLGDLVLLKGSRGMELERLTDALVPNRTAEAGGLSGRGATCS